MHLRLPCQELRINGSNFASAAKDAKLEHK